MILARYCLQKNNPLCHEHDLSESAKEPNEARPLGEVEGKGGLCSYLQVTSPLGSAAFSQAVEAIDIKTGAYVCLKVIKVLTCSLRILRSWHKDLIYLIMTKMKCSGDMHQQEV